MSDPPRLRDLSDGDGSFARDLLRDAPASRPFTAGDAARLQLRVAKATAASSSGWFVASAVPKVLATVAVIAAGGVAIRATHRPRPTTAVHAPAARPQPTRSVTEPQPVVAPPAVEVAPAPPEETAAATSPSAPVEASNVRTRVLAPRVRRVESAPVVVAEAPAAPAAPTLSDELRVVEEAREALRADPARAAQMLTDASRSMPRGQLRDERDALLVEALARAGRWDEARTRAAELERRAPQSPQGARVRALLRDAP